MRFHRNMEWKWIQVYDWNKICVLTIVTWNLTERWTENVSKYNIELISVYLKWKTWDFTEIWNENQSKLKIELISVYLTCWHEI